MNVLIVEDEFHIARQLQDIIEQDDNFKVVEKLESVAETVIYLNEKQSELDLLFFDIQLADGYSFDIFKHVDIYIPIVFCTAYDEYGLMAIQNNGIDYILKPLKETDIFKALNKYKRLISNIKSKHNQVIAFELDKNTTYQTQFISKFRDRSVIIDINDISLFSIENDIVYLYRNDGLKFPLFKKLEYISSVVNPNLFYRINRQMLVNRKAILAYHSITNRKIALDLKINISKEIVVSRLKVSSFKTWMEK